MSNTNDVKSLENLKYVIIGAGGTGGVIGADMAKAGKDVTLIARGRHLEAIKGSGLKTERLWDGSEETVDINAASMEEYAASMEKYAVSVDEQAAPNSNAAQAAGKADGKILGKADVIFVCVKSYSVEETIPFIKQISHEDTIVIPVLNVYGTGGRMQEALPGLTVTDGCIYVSANIKEPGVILRHGKICRVLFGERELSAEDSAFNRAAEKIGKDLRDSGIDVIVSKNIRKDALQKFSYVSPAGAAGLYFDAAAGDFQKASPQRDMFRAMVGEIVRLAGAMGITYEEDLAEVNLKILESLSPEATTSMQRDVKAGKESEADGLVFEVVRLAEAYGVDVPCYKKAAEKIKRMLV